MKHLHSAHLLLVVASLALLAGCPPTTENEDAAIPETDAGSDSGTDAPTVDAPTDVDGDGIPADRDCNDDDASVGSSGSRSCDGPCGPGVAACVDGMWRACEASTACLCPTEGMTRTMPCGSMCGMRTDTCTGLRWVEGTTCDDEGVCEPGAVEMMDGRWCLVTSRTCQDDCAWGATEIVTPEGDCGPDFVSCGIPIVRCSEDCRIVTATTDPRCP